MGANQTFESILKNIKLSNLNFTILESPFSATVTIKKTFIKNKDGTLRSSGIEINQQQVLITSMSTLPKHRDVIVPELPHSSNISFATTKKMPQCSSSTKFYMSNFDPKSIQQQYTPGTPGTPTPLWTSPSVTP